MLKIRLQRIGRKNDPSFRLIVTESTNAAKRGKYIELLGTFNPHADKPIMNEERIKHWIGHGAQPSLTVHNMLITAGVISGKKINALPKKTVIKKEEVAPVGTPAEAPVTEAEAPAAEEIKADETAETPVA